MVCVRSEPSGSTCAMTVAMPYADAIRIRRLGLKWVRTLEWLGTVWSTSTRHPSTSHSEEPYRGSIGNEFPVIINEAKECAEFLDVLTSRCLDDIAVASHRWGVCCPHQSSVPENLHSVGTSPSRSTGTGETLPDSSDVAPGSGQ